MPLHVAIPAHPKETGPSHLAIPVHHRFYTPSSFREKPLPGVRSTFPGAGSGKRDRGPGLRSGQARGSDIEGRQDPGHNRLMRLVSCL